MSNWDSAYSVNQPRFHHGFHHLILSGQLVLINPVFVVRREKALIRSRGKSRPRTGSLHPVAIEAAVEDTKLLKPRRLGEQAGRHVSER
jgi:hypothetical protein